MEAGYISKEPFLMMHCERGDSYDLGVAMNYGYCAGSPHLLRFITEHVELIHDPPYKDWTTCLTSGSTSAFEIVLRVLCEPGDCLLAEKCTYSAAISTARLLNLSVIGVEIDEFGLVPEDLDAQLRNWDYARAPKPFVLYMIPSGQNPTGVTQSNERRKLIYKVAEEHNLCIIEDDPYYYIQMTQNTEEPVSADALAEAEQFIKTLPPSYLSLDVSGRVVRLDTASKIIAPGLRLGWITAPAALTARFLHYVDLGTVAPAGPSQLMLYRLLDEQWGHVGFLKWLRRMSVQFARSRDVLVAACTRCLPHGLCRWRIPTAGMFMWISFDTSRHPRTQERVSLSEEGKASLTEIEDNIFVAARANGVQVCKGSWFKVGLDSQSELSFRLSFAAVPEGSLEEGVLRFAKAVREEFHL